MITLVTLLQIYWWLYQCFDTVGWAAGKGL